MSYNWMPNRTNYTEFWIGLARAVYEQGWADDH